ncbi:cobalt/nickel transport protein [Balnearium lithotrophicum]|uniref:Cobalt/nickel transport protein n=1 Tax=Balnearium lithotrophicum TaxID=223788 RepID=A0A521D4P5_9BACT|nr:DUF4198 domain-containing protein [Balnearium lithotrophicum]SMO66683.1 cobalt/nickel transport protein [Balnearium lithotrophicum]
MRKLLLTLSLFLAGTTGASAHFMLLKPSTDIVEGNHAKTIEIEAKFTHPMEGAPNMPFKILKSGVFINGHVEKLHWKKIMIPAAPGSNKKVPMYKAEYKLRRPGVYQFFIYPSAYFEPAEEKFIQQVTKVEVEGFGMEDGWNKPIGLKAEIVPVTRPFGLWEGNTFKGRVYFNGKPARNVRVEIEYLNTKGIKVPADAFVTQVVRTDNDGYFVYTIPWAGWWGFSAIGYGGKKRYKDGKLYPVEFDAVMWIKAYPKPEGVK